MRRAKWTDCRTIWTLGVRFLFACVVFLIPLLAEAQEGSTPIDEADEGPSPTTDERQPRGYLFIYHIDVGQGDATLIVSPEGKTLLVDGGNDGFGAEKVLPLLSKLRINSLDYIVTTHYDADHIGGLDEIVPVVGDVTVYDRGAPERDITTDAFENYLEAVEGKRESIAPGDTIALGQGVSVVCVAVNGQVFNGADADPNPDEENTHSVALKIRFGGFDYFVGGDLTGRGKKNNIEKLLVNAGVVGDLDVLKASHHGSATSSSKTFLNAVKPEVVIVSVGNGGVNKTYKHPSRKVVDRLLLLEGLQAIFQTNRGETNPALKEKELETVRVADGDVVLSTDGRAYVINGVSFPVDEVTAEQ